MRNIEEVGFLEKGTGKHQSNIVYGAGVLHLHYVQRWVLKLQ